MRFEPLPDIRDGILVERLVQTIRHVADMRRCQYVVQRPEGVRRRQRLNVECVDRRAGNLLVFLIRAFLNLSGPNSPVGSLEQLVLGNQDCARGFGGLGCHVLAPGNQPHSKSAPDPRDL